MASKIKISVSMATLFVALAAVSEAATYTVGDSTGWIVPSNNDFYANWANNKNFAAGDTLVFNFTTGQDNVAEVTEADYDACTTTDTIFTDNNGPARIRVNRIGDHYFICTVPGHCSGGQKVMIEVGTISNSPRNSPPGVLSPNSASSVVATMSVGLIFVALLLFY